MKEQGGVGSFANIPFFWMESDSLRPRRELSICASFEDGNVLWFENNAQGWTEFVVWAMLITNTFM